MSETKTLDNVHVVIYSKRMLKEAVKRLSNSGRKVEESIFSDYEYYHNDLLIFHNELFMVVHILPVTPCYEVTLNRLMEIILSEPRYVEKNRKDLT